MFWCEIMFFNSQVTIRLWALISPEHLYEKIPLVVSPGCLRGLTGLNRQSRITVIGNCTKPYTNAAHGKLEREEMVVCAQ